MAAARPLRGQQAPTPPSPVRGRLAPKSPAAAAVARPLRGRQASILPAAAAAVTSALTAAALRQRGPGQTAAGRPRRPRYCKSLADQSVTAGRRRVAVGPRPAGTEIAGCGCGGQAGPWPAGPDTAGCRGVGVISDGGGRAGPGRLRPAGPDMAGRPRLWIAGPDIIMAGRPRRRLLHRHLQYASGSASKRRTRSRRRRGLSR